jgi:CheY-like chemotaxis protein
VIELHGGSVQARSRGLGFGTEFIVRLPLSTQAPVAVSSGEIQSRVSTGRFRVLVVDDNKDAADTLNLLLESMGQEVFTVYDGLSALGAARTFRPDLVLLDIGMPQKSGYDVAREMLAANCDPKPIMVAITGWGQDADKERAVGVGFDYHFVKPISEVTLQKLLTQLSKPK